MKDIELFLYELEGRGFSFQDKTYTEFGFNDEVLNMVYEMWQASASREGYKLVPICDYNELVRSNRYKQEVNIKLSEEVRILRERKKFYKQKLKSVNSNFKLLPIEPADSILKFIGGSKQEATLIYKAMVRVFK